MFPSPSLGPPLLSASWSPPLFCGIEEVAEDDFLEADCDVPGAFALELELEPPPPQPAMTNASTTAPRPRRAGSERRRAEVAPVVPGVIRRSRRRRWGRRCC